MKSSVLLLLAVSFFPTQARAQIQDIETISWMSGCWMATQRSGEVEENWTIPKGGTMLGISRTVRGDRTTGFEYVMIRRIDDRLVYSANPSGQVAADFAASVASDRLLRVEKPDHDFPQKIEYERLSTDSIVARVFGNVSDSDPAFSLNYARVDCQ